MFSLLFQEFLGFDWAKQILVCWIGFPCFSSKNKERKERAAVGKENRNGLYVCNDFSAYGSQDLDL